jgi:hypothetical protein
MVKELPITNSTRDDLRLALRPIADAYLGPDYRGRHYLIPPGDEWCVHAPEQDTIFAIQVGNDAVVVLVDGCDIESVTITEHPTMERPARAIVPIDD